MIIFDFKLWLVYILSLTVFIPIMGLVTKSYDIFKLKKFDTIIFFSFWTFTMSFILLIFTLYFLIDNNIQLFTLFLVFFIFQICIYLIIKRIGIFMIVK